MKKTYKRICYYVVDRWICEGYIDKHGFHLAEDNWEEDAYKNLGKLRKKTFSMTKTKL